MYRKEFDTIGEINVPSDKYWGAQTERSLKNFNIGEEKFTTSFINVYAMVKMASAIANYKLNQLSFEKKELICSACKDIISGKLSNNFPLSVWQTGSGTQTNMNLNEVISNRANELNTGILGKKFPIHPNDDVNLSQSTNDTFPTAMHISVFLEINNSLLPALSLLNKEIKEKEIKFSNDLKIGRTHLQDALPMTIGQEFSAFHSQIEKNINYIKKSLDTLRELPIGATAIGTGVNTKEKYSKFFVDEISQITGFSFVCTKNKFSSISSHDELINFSGILKTLATSLMKISNDIRWLSSGPRCGISELEIPTNEPGSSMMPGKINPTQCEALMMVCCQVIGNDFAVTLGGSSGNFQLNNFKPLIIYNILQSIKLITDSCNSFSRNLVQGININKETTNKNVEKSLMLVTCLVPYIGYDKSAKIANYAYKNNCSLLKASEELGILDSDEFKKIVQPSKLTYPNL